MKPNGFTLVELLVALFIFGMLSAAGVTLLSFSVRSQGMAEERLGRTAELRRAGALLASDFGQAAPRLVRDRAGARRAAFRGGVDEDAAVALVRRGWENVDGAPRPSLQKVEYRLANGRLERRAYPFLDGAEPMAFVIVAEGVEAMTIRYRDAKGEWRNRWDPADPAALPGAVEVTLATSHSGTVRQLFLAGAGA